MLSPEYKYFDYVLGLYLADKEIITRRGANAGGAEIFTPGILNSSSVAGYFHGNYYLTHSLELSAGLRIQHYEKDIDYSITDNVGSLGFIDDNLLDSLSSTEVLPSISLNYSPDSRSLAYARVSRSFKEAGWNADFLTSLARDQVRFNEEFATSGELGFKYSSEDGSWNISTALFNTLISDYQVFQFVSNGTTTVTQLTNAGEVRLRGLEIDSAIAVYGGLSVIANAAYLFKAEYTDFKDGGGIGVDFDNNQLPYAPKLKSYLSFSYFYENDSGMERNMSISYSYSGSSFSNPSNSFAHKVKSYDRIDLVAEAQLSKGWKLSLWAKNLADKVYLRSRDVSFLQVQRGVYEPPRTYGVSIKYQIESLKPRFH